ncbi:MAG: QueT transporter family protein [Firmicutes bacterium]|nr:QueT transporter family protein [Bacillota bacterium]
MQKKTRFLVYGGVIAALYLVLTHLQNMLIPDSTSWAVQFRASEALCVLALFTPAAIPGLTLGCLLFNITYAQALPLDFLLGSLASCLAAATMYLTRRQTVCGYPLLAMCMPALWNAILVGGELTVYIGGGFLLNAVLVAVGELAVLLTLGSVLYYAIRLRHLDKRLFAA